MTDSPARPPAPALARPDDRVQLKPWQREVLAKLERAGCGQFNKGVTATVRWSGSRLEIWIGEQV